ncbi:MAG: LamG-like jellyroll fold domain-containing protein, partial [Ferruginibacter sp.]
MQNLLQHRLKLINKSKAIFIKLLFFSFSIMFFTTARAQTGQALNFDGINDYVSLPFAINGDYTKEAWINLASTSGASNIVSGNNTYFYVTAGGILTAGQSGSIAVVSDVTALVPGIWYHVAVTFNATSGAMNLYKNGAVVSSGVAPAYIEPVLEIGRFSSANYFNGTMDEVRVWSTERSVSEIPASKDCELTGDEPGLLAYYKFNQGTAGANNSSITTIADSSDKCNVFNGTLNNFTLMTGTSNFIAPGAPVSGTCANFFSNINLTGNNNCIVNGDVTPSLTDFTDFGSYGSSPISRTFVIQNTGNTALNITSVTITGVNASDFSFAAPASTVAAGGFTNLVVTFSPTGANGIKNATITINNDDVDEGTFTFNITGNFAGPGKALAFDGIDDRVDLPFNISGDYTKEAWINTNTASGAQNIVTGTNTYFYVNGGFLTAGQGGSFAVVTDGTALVPNTWYQVAVTYNATSGVMSLYKDGALVASNPAPAYTETPLQIGAFGGSSNFSGTIDEVRIWNVEKTVGQIMAFKNCELNGAEANLIAYYNFNEGINGGDNTGLTTLNDLHGNCPLNGKLVNFALTGNTSNWVA